MNTPSYRWSFSVWTLFLAVASVGLAIGWSIDHWAHARERAIAGHLLKFAEYLEEHPDGR